MSNPVPSKKLELVIFALTIIKDVLVSIVTEAYDKVITWVKSRFGGVNE